ncbi:SFRICE_018075 [Gryllus bimaculatus]|nr:SFRICE_018075 [Gryllus bimaculatus]
MAKADSGGLDRYFSSNMENVKKLCETVIKSEEDKCRYRGLELKNDLKVLLISDNCTDKSAAALDVNVGCMSDPVELPGLAHFCEHMLFLGTEKYPAENEYTKFLSEHGGASNAYTFSDHTNYFFDVLPEHLSGALDRFSQFFIAPLFSESATDREVNAVNSEHEKNIPNDSWRLDQLEKSTSKPNHDYNKFGTGNKMTLETIPKEKGINVREELLKFHDKWYSSNIMSLCIIGKESLDDLQEMAVSMFSNVKNKTVKVPYWPEHPFGPEQVKIKGYVVPVKDLRTLNITFPIPDLHEYYKAGPGHYLSHLFGHEGPGSLLSVLRTKSWCNTLVGGARTSTMGFGFFGINVDLTDEGIEHVDEIVQLVFQYVNLLKAEGPMEWIFKECSDIARMHFRFKDKEAPQSYASTTAVNLQLYPLEEVLSGPYITTEWRPDLIEMVLSYLTPQNVRQMWENAGRCESLHLPPVNEFIPTDFSLMPREENPAKYPSIIQDTALTRVWFKQDDEFLLPKANVSFEFVSPLAYLDPLSCNMTYIFVELFKDSLNEYAYAAELAGLRWELSNTKYGMVLGVCGYHSKQHVLLEKIAEKLTSFKIDPKRFEILKENYIRGLKNFEAEQPYQHAINYLSIILAEQAWIKEELLAACDDLHLETVQSFIPQILSKMHIECLIHGNCTQQRALQLVSLVEERIRSRCSYVFQVENTLHRSSCAEVYYQCGLQSTQTNMLLELLVKITTEPCFNNLRTKEQLGYIVSSGIRRANGVQGLRIIVQSDKHPKYVDQRVEAFVHFIKDYLDNLSDAEFERHKESLAAQRLEKPKRLAALSARFWAEITSQQYNFDRAQIEVAHLRTLHKQDIVDFYDATKIENITDFKSTQAMYPLVQPYVKIPKPTNTKAKL